MNTIKIYDYFRLFFKSGKSKIPVYFILSLFLGLSEGAGVFLLIPMLALAGIIKSYEFGNIPKGIVNLFNKFSFIKNIYVIIIIYILIMLIKNVLNIYRSVLSSQIEQEFVLNIRSKLYENIIYSEWKFFMEHGRNSISYIFVNETAKLGAGTGTLLQISGSLVIAVIQFCMALLVSAKITILALASSIALGIIMLPINKKLTDSSIDSYSLFQKWYSQLSDHLHSIKDIKSLGIENMVFHKFISLSAQIKNIYMTFAKLHSISSAVNNMMAAFLLSGYVLIVVELKCLSPGTVLLLAMLFLKLWGSFTYVLRGYQSALMILPSYNAVFGLEKECLKYFKESEKGAIDYEAYKNNPGLKSGIILKNVKFSYNIEASYELQINYAEIIPNCITAIVGKSGSGKSTIADLLTGLLIPDTGDIVIDGIRLNRGNIRNWRRCIGYVLQDSFLYNDTIRENLKFGCENISLQELQNALKLSGAYDFVSRLPHGIDTIIGDNGVCLSGGERQRIVIARALLRKPSILIFDEATSSLDIESENEIKRTILKLKEYVTVIVIAHRLSTIINADRIIVVEDGKIVECGTYDELHAMESGKFKKLME